MFRTKPPSLLRFVGTDRQPLGDVHSRANEQLQCEPDWAQAGTKRKATEDVAEHHVDLSGVSMESCNVVRGKIRRLLDSGEMKKGEFARTIGVSPSGLNSFLGHSQTMGGAGCDAYGNAWEFFKRRELAKKAMPKAKKQKAAAPAFVSAPASASGASASGRSGSGPSPRIDIRGIAIAGEASDSVRVYDSCDEIRKKINAHIMESGVTQAQFCRDLESQIHTQVKKIQSKQLADFRSKKGPTSGNTSIVYYTAYVFFEKYRLAQGKPKSKHRVGMESEHPQGADTENVRNRFLCTPGMVPTMNSFGTVRIVSRY